MAKTEHRDYELPDEGKTVKEEFETLRDDTLPKIDADMHAVMEDLAGKSPSDHGHPISGIDGLATALAGKMPSGKTFALADLTDVIGVADAADGYIPVKVGDEVVMQSAASALGPHTHTASQILGLGDVLAGKADASALEGYVAYTEQSPTPEQQETARSNIGAAKAGEDSEPVGSVTMRMGPLKPGCIAIGEGGTYSRATYPQLAAWMDEHGEEAFALTALQIVNGELPNWRDYSPRTAGGALGPAAGAKQEDAFQGHQHSFHDGDATGGSTRAAQGFNATSTRTTPILPNSVGGPTTDGTNGTPRTASETRVKSFGVRWQIRAAGAVSDSGTVNMLTVSSRVSELSSKAVQVDRSQAFTDTEKQQAAENLGLVFRKEYVSAQQTITSSGALTLTHGLGVVPKLIALELVCVTADAGYAVGEVMHVPAGYYGSNTVTAGPVIKKTSSQILLRLSNTFQSLNFGTASSVDLTNNAWRLIVRAWA